MLRVYSKENLKRMKKGKNQSAGLLAKGDGYIEKTSAVMMSVDMGKICFADLGVGRGKDLLQGRKL